MIKAGLLRGDTTGTKLRLDLSKPDLRVCLPERRQFDARVSSDVDSKAEAGTGMEGDGGEAGAGLADEV